MACAKFQDRAVVKTSSEVIKEAKAELIKMNAKVVKTKRPFTPKEANRFLFGPLKKNERPSSSVEFDFRNMRFEGMDFRYKFVENERIHTVQTKLPTIKPKSFSILDKLSEEAYEGKSMGQKQNTTTCVCKIDSRGLPRIKLESTGNKKTSPKEYGVKSENVSKEKAHDVESVQSLIISINKDVIRGYETKGMISSLDKLYAAMEREELLKVSNDYNFTKNLVFKSVFRMIDCPEERLLIKVAKIILALRVAGPNLANACKAVFKLARMDSNDDVFQEESDVLALLVDNLGLAIPDEDAEALIYGYGALKFLTTNANMLKIALESGLLQLMTLHLKIINLVRNEDGFVSDKTNHILFQLTSCLRNAANESMHDQFIECGALAAVCKVCQLFTRDADVVLNCARILSVLSTSEESCYEISNVSGLDAMIKVADRYFDQEDLVVRMMYAVGNIAACCEQARSHFRTNLEETMNIVMKLMRFYLEMDLKTTFSNSPNSARNQIIIEDILVKIIRVVANMCIDIEIGTDFIMYEGKLKQNGNETFIDCLLAIIRRKDVNDNSELILSTLRCLNNLTYYNDGEDSRGYFQIQSVCILKALNSLIRTKNVECMAELTRVYGNLTRCKQIQTLFLESGGLTAVTVWLDSTDEGVLCCAVGVLVNLLSDGEARRAFGIAGFKLLLDILNQVENRWELANLVCQAIWNYMSGEEGAAKFGFNGTRRLIDSLVDLLDEEKLFPQELKMSGEYQQWEDFSYVATDILEKMDY